MEKGAAIGVLVSAGGGGEGIPPPPFFSVLSITTGMQVGVEKTVYCSNDF